MIFISNNLKEQLWGFYCSQILLFTNAISTANITYGEKYPPSILASVRTHVFLMYKIARLLRRFLAVPYRS